MSLEIRFFSKKKYYFTIAFFSFFVYLLPNFFNERSHNKLLVFKKGSIEHSFEGQSMALRLR